MSITSIESRCESPRPRPGRLNPRQTSYVIDFKRKCRHRLALLASWLDRLRRNYVITFRGDPKVAKVGDESDVAIDILALNDDLNYYFFKSHLPTLDQPQDYP